MHLNPNKITISLIICIACSFVVKAQSPVFNWAKQVSCSFYSYGNSIVADAAGNVYTTGAFFGTADLDPGPGTYTVATAGDRDIFISKLDASGNFVWAKTIGGAYTDFGQAITVDATGNIYVTGEFTGPVDFDPNVGHFFLVSNSSNPDMFTLKLDGSGNFVWVKQISGPQPKHPMSIAVDASGSIYTTGDFSGPVDFDPGPATFTLFGYNNSFVNKLDAAGNFAWTKQLGAVYCKSLKTDSQGNVFTTGYFSGNANFDQGVTNYTVAPASYGYKDAFVCKHAASGNILWVKALGGIFDDSGQAIALDAADNIYVTGNFFNTTDLDPGPGTFTMTSGSMTTSDAFVCKLNAAGNFIWAKQLGGTGDDAGLALAVDASENVYVTGSFTGTGDFDPGPGTYTLASAGGVDAFINRLNTNGDFVWTVQIGGFTHDYCWSIYHDANGNIYTTGAFSGTLDFDPGPATYLMTSAGSTVTGHDAFIYKLNSCIVPPAPGLINNTSVICTGATNIYSITPVSGALQYSWLLPAGWQGASSTNSINVASGAGGGSITVAASNTCGASVASTLFVSPGPTITAVSSKSAMCIAGTATLTASGASSYTWSQGSISPAINISPTVTTTYSVTGSNVYGCLGTVGTISQFVAPDPTVTAVSSDSIICIGQTATLTASGASSYVWSSGSASSEINISPPANTTYSVAGTNVYGCSNTATVSQNVALCTGIAGIVPGNTGLSIFPNPFTNNFYVVSDVYDNEPIFIFNAQGALVQIAERLSNKTEVNLSLQPAGIYFMKVGTITKKLVKE